MTRLLIPGGKGQVGTFAARHATSFGFEVFAPDLGEIDITDPQSVASVFADFQPDIVINCAAYTAVDKAENERELARAINVDGTANLAKLCAPDIPLLHISTDYVFDGDAQKPYDEVMVPAPLNVYGETKLDGEQRLQALHPKSIILRTAWVYGPTHSNFLKTMLSLGQKLDSVSVVNDQHGSPTHAEDIALTLLTIAQKICSGSFAANNYGIYHYTGSGATTWHEFARVIFDELEIQTQNATHANPIPTSEFPTPARRANYSILDNRKINQVFGVTSVDWEPRVRSAVREILNQESSLS